MSDLACNFCAHGNPEGSKFCNECGSPLNLTPCGRCEAVNAVSAERCHQCDAPLSSGDPVGAEPPAMALSEIAQSAGSAPTRDDPVPISLAERWWKPAAPSVELEATVDDPPFRASAPAAASLGPADEVPLRPSRAAHATYAGRDRSYRARGFFLVVAFVAVGAGAATLYWRSIDPVHLADRRTIADGAPSAATDSASNAAAGAAQTADAPDPSPTEDRLPSAGPAPLSAGSPAAGEPIAPSEERGPPKEASSEAPATVRESTPPDAAAAPPPAAPQETEGADAQASSRAKAAESPAAGTASTTETNDPRRAAAKSRTREQAERDAIETRRLIARELAASPPGNSNDRKPPGP